MKTHALFLAAALLTACGVEDNTSGLGPGPGPGQGGNAGDGGWSADGGYVQTPGVPVLPNDPAINDPTVPVLLDSSCAPGAPGAPDPATLQKLQAGGAPGSARVLYPYDGTVFPRGLAAPLVMWEGASGVSNVYVHITGPNFEYKGCAGASANNQFQLPQDVWEAAGKKTRGKSLPFQVELTVLSNGQVVGPLTTQWIIAQATIKGSIYYNSYTSLKGIPGMGKTLRIVPGKEAEAYIAFECNGCHSVSANGARLATQTLLTGARAYDIGAGNPVSLPNRDRAAFVGMYPDGSRYVLPSLQVEVARSQFALGGPVFLGSRDAALVNTDTNGTMPSPGLSPGALMPTFSSDGKMLVFTDAAANSRAIAALDFDANSNVFSNYRVLFQDSNLKPGWPFALPDNQGVVFVRTDALSDWSGNGAGVGGGLTAILGPYSELFMVDASTGQSTILARAMGYATAADATAKRTYLPFGNEDIGKVYFPTVSPVAAGGYFWVFFDAMRHYGNLGQQRQLWGTAVEISPSGDYSVDLSNPAFYLPGQEFGTGNHRAFTALDACKMDGDSCTSGVDCCGGFCTLPPTAEFGTTVGTCSSTAACARTDEKCQTSADCCPVEGGSANSCIGGFCAQVPILQ